MAKDRVFAVVGLGTFGMEVCSALSQKGGKVIAVDNQPEVIDKIKDNVTQAILVDATDEESLKSVPLSDVDVAVVAIGDNIEASILATVLFRQKGVPYILSRAVSKTHEHVLKQVGANEVVNIEIAEGRRIAAELISPSILDKIPVDSNVSIAEVLLPDSFAGKSLKELDLRNTYRINVVTLKRPLVTVDEMGNPNKDEMVLFPGPEEVLKSSDIIIVIGRNEDIELLKEF
jgi:trk system potassium uptake protein